MLLAISLVTLGCGCGDGEGPYGQAGGSGGGAGAAGGSGGTGGSGSGPRDLEVQPFLYRPPEQPVEVLQAGDALSLWHAPQGGHVVVVGARVRGLTSDFIELRARVRVPETRVIVAEEARTVVMEAVAGEPDWKQTDRRTCSQASHVPLCPNYSDRDVVAREHVLEVIVTELYADFSVGQSEITVTPSCLQSDPIAQAFCVCECSADYTLGKCSRPPLDGGVPTCPE